MDNERSKWYDTLDRIEGELLELRDAVQLENDCDDFATERIEDAVSQIQLAMKDISPSRWKADERG